MSRQTFQGSIQWIVVDDGVVPTECTMGQEYYRREPNTASVIGPATHTVGANLEEALNHVKSPKILVIEDDDYYSPNYLSHWTKLLDSHDLVGESGSKYYRLDNETYQHYDGKVFTTFAALARTGFRRNLISMVKKACSGDCQVDRRIWDQSSTIKSHLEMPSVSGLHISIKGGPGRGSHNHKRSLTQRDRNYSQLLLWTKGDWDAASRYREICNPFKGSLVVYTALTHNKRGIPYSYLRRPSYSKGVEFVCLTDRPDIKYDGWTSRCPAYPEGMDKQMLSRYWKALPHRWFPNHEWSVYIDSSMTLKVNPRNLVRDSRNRWPDLELSAVQHPHNNNVLTECLQIIERGLAPVELIKSQLASYISEGHSQLEAFQCGLLIRRNSEKVKEFNELWWKEIEKYKHRRDQPSFPVAVAKSGIAVKAFSHHERATKITKWTGHTGGRPKYPRRELTGIKKPRGLAEHFKKRLDCDEVVACPSFNLIYLIPWGTGGRDFHEGILKGLFGKSAIRKLEDPIGFKSWLASLSDQSLKGYRIWSFIADPLLRFGLLLEELGKTPSELLERPLKDKSIKQKILPLTRYTHWKGSTFCDYYVRLESFEHDALQVLGELGIHSVKVPVYGGSPKREDSTIAGLVGSIYREDFDSYSYKIPEQVSFLGDNLACDCLAPGVCSKYNRVQSERDFEICNGTHCKDSVVSKYKAAWKNFSYFNIAESLES